MQIYDSKPIRAALAVALLANGTTIHGFWHRHSGGDVAHVHVHDHGPSGRAHIDDDHDHHHHYHCHYHEHGQVFSRSVSEMILAAAPTSHLHVSFFGIEFSIPSSDFGDDPLHGSPGFAPAAFVLPTIPVTATMLSLRDVIMQLVIAVDHQTAHIFREDDVSACPRPQQPTAPLCDSARRERTGVLLI